MRRAWVALAAVPAALLASVSPLGDDYGNLACHVRSPRCDEASFAINALAHGHFATFVHEQPLMGPVSLVLRAPFVAVADWLEADLTWHYRAGVFACLLVSALLALMLARESRARGHFWLPTAAIAVLAFVNPLAVSAISLGHPEELVASAAVVAAALFVLRGRPMVAALLVALAVATKAWALLAVLPILLAAPAQARRRFATVVALVVLACYTPLIAGDPGRFHDLVRAAGSLGSHYGEVTPSDPWFYTARTGEFDLLTEARGDSLVFKRVHGYAVSHDVARLAHALVVLLALGLTLAWWKGGAARRRESLLLLLAAILVGRCVLDPGNHLYYHAAAALALLGYEAIGPRKRFPWLAGGFIASLWVLTRINAQLHTDTAFSIVYMVWAVPTLAGLALAVCLRSRSTPPTPQLRISPRHATGSPRA